ncbi:MAG TPA: LytR C-terminal domain-containing protein [Kribbella sp.]|nr:LytR C-terminal domain-containing protein [Kribbella sp.]
MSSRETDERGQVLSSFVAVAAVVAIVAGLLVLFGTRGDDSAADPQPAAKSSTPKPSSSSAPVTTSATPMPSASESDSPSAEPTQPPTTTVAPIPTADLPAVEIFNNTNRRGLAEQVASRARAAGWQVTGADNWHGKIVTSTVYYPAGMQAAAAQLAKVLGIGRIKDALPNMKQDRLSVILTSDYSG